jgi:hypothetical protein
MLILTEPAPLAHSIRPAPPGKCPARSVFSAGTNVGWAFPPVAALFVGQAGSLSSVPLAPPVKSRCSAGEWYEETAGRRCHRALNALPGGAGTGWPGPPCRVATPGRRSRIAGNKPGGIVRIRCHRSAPGCTRRDSRPRSGFPWRSLRRAGASLGAEVRQRAGFMALFLHHLDAARAAISPFSPWPESAQVLSNQHSVRLWWKPGLSPPAPGRRRVHSCCKYRTIRQLRWKDREPPIHSTSCFLGRSQPPDPIGMSIARRALPLRLCDWVSRFVLAPRLKKRSATPPTDSRRRKGESRCPYHGEGWCC